MTRNREEYQIQEAVCKLLRWRNRQFWAVPNQGKRNLIYAMALKRIGVTAGVSDLHILCNGRFYALELKARGMKATASQIEWQQQVLRNGGCATIAAGMDQAEKVLREWGLI